MPSRNKVSGCLYGLAFGDAYGAPTEFMSYNDILGRRPIGGPVDLEGDPALVTDDTQMTLAVGQALVESLAADSFTPQTFEKALRLAFVEWLNSPDNDRAPGMTCLKACENLERGQPWIEATQKHSKGCGANMRVAPVGLLPLRDNPTSKDRAAMAQFQAAMTHGHPTALAASDLTAFAVAELANGGGVDELRAKLREYAHSQRLVYHEEWLGALWQRPGVDSAEAFISRGWDECLRVLDSLDAGPASLDYSSDPCLVTGAGWVAEEAFGTGLFCFLMFPEQPQRVLQRAAMTSGDSDSIACLAGALAGAYLGLESWPQEWVTRIEYGDKLAKLAEQLGE